MNGDKAGVLHGSDMFYILIRLMYINVTYSRSLVKCILVSAK